MLIAFTSLAIFGDLIGFYKKAAGIGVSLVIGIIGIICVFYFIALFFMGFFIPILMIFLGGLIGLIVNYQNLKDWREQRGKGIKKPKEKQEGVEKKGKNLIILGVILLILGGVLIYLSISVAMGALSILIYPGMVFMVVGPSLIIFSIIQRRR